MDKSEILHEELLREIRLKYLRQNSPYFPNVLTEKKGGIIEISSLVRIVFNDKWYTIHVIKSYHFDDLEEYEKYSSKILEEFMIHAYTVLVLFKFDPMQCIEDDLQISEQDRLLMDYLR